SAALIAAVLSAYYQVLAGKIAQSVLLELRKRVFQHTQKLGVDFHEKYTSGRIISRQTSDLEAIGDLLSGGINNLITGLLYMVFVLIATIMLDPISGLILVIALIPLGMLSRWFQKRSAVAFREIRGVSAQVIVQFVETMAGIRAVKAFRTAKQERQKYAEVVEEYRGKNVKAIRLFGIFDPGLVMLGNVAVAAIVLFGGL